MAPIDFYHAPFSPASRGALLTARQLELDLNIKVLDLFKGEQLKPEFVALNPEHTVPTIVDDGYVLWESRAVCTYLAAQYGKGDWLYPHEPKQRARVDRALMFDMGTLSCRFDKYVMPVVFQGQKPDPEALKSLQEALRLLDNFLGGCKYCAALHITVADHRLAATVETIKHCKINIARYANLKAWLQRCKENMPGYHENEVGAKLFGEFAAARFKEVSSKN
ncbi:Glutathione S-transferase C-terminal [Trinorchestia longiramus]|nr:Glutathione S-transferase C-terminal [Trinorchestia longiramus]